MRAACNIPVISKKDAKVGLRLYKKWVMRNNSFTQNTD
jgi:hypothetical protein